MKDLITLQREADEHITMLRRNGYHDAADGYLAMRSAAYEREEKLIRIHNMIARKIRGETDR